MKTSLISCCCAAALLASGQLLAAELRWQVYGTFGTVYHTNPTKVEDNEQDDTSVVATLGGRLYQDTEKLFLDLEYRGRHDNWIDNTFDDRSTLEGYGQLLWQPSNYFALYINNRRQDLIVNNTFADTQDNRSVRSTTELGARFTARIGRVDTLNIAPVYRAVNFSSGDGVDSRRPGLLGFWSHRISKLDTFGINLFAERAMFESGSAQTDYDRGQLFASYSARLNRLSYDLQAGVTKAVGDDSNLPEGADKSDNDFSGTLFRGFADYEHRNHLFRLWGFHDLTDTSIGLSDNTVGGVSFNPGDTDVNQLALVTRTQFGLSYDLAFAAERWNWGIEYRFDQQDVEARADDDIPGIGARDQKRHWTQTTLTYRMTRNIEARLLGTYEYIEFLDSPAELIPVPPGVTPSSSGPNREDDIYRLGLVFNFQIFKYGRLSFGAEHEQRETNAFAVSNYSDNKIFANIRLEFPQVKGGRRGSGGIGSVGGAYGF